MMDTMDGIKPQITSHTDALNSILIYDEAVGLSSLSSVSLITTASVYHSYKTKHGLVSLKQHVVVLVLQVCC